MPAAASIYHDLRRKKINGLYPVKLRVYFDGVTKYYPLSVKGNPLDLSKDDFTKSYLSQAPRIQKYRDLQIQIQAIEARGNDILRSLAPFSWEKFEKQMFRSSSAIGNVFEYYHEAIQRLKDEERIGTASSYHLSERSLKSFLKAKRKTPELSFDAITPDFLNSYERWMVQQGKELSTVGIYLRPLRAIYNAAIEAGEVSKDLYPFRKGRYQIPAGSNVKKALSKEDLKALFEAVTDDHNIIKARSFWFFSYLCNGINVRDICELKYKNIKKETIEFTRSKTIRTTKGNQTPIVAAIVPLVAEVIKIYGNKKESPETYVFPVYKHTMTATDKHTATKTFTRYINQHMKKLAEIAGVMVNVGTYAARHTFSTISVRSGASIEFIQKTLGHQNMKTTMLYLGSLDDQSIKDNAANLLKF